MRPFIFQRTVLMLITICHVAHCALNPNPRNEYAIVNITEAVFLNCTSTLGYPLTWKTVKPPSSRKDEIFNGYHLIEDVNNVGFYCKVENGSPGKYDLKLNVTKDAAQRYICLEPGSLKEESAEVIIIESNPECNVTFNSESTNFTCNVRFSGNWAPVMEWKNSSNDELISEGVYIDFVPYESLTSRLVVPNNQNQNPQMNYTCTTRFRINEKPSETTANNVPAYNYPWTSSVVVPEAESRTKNAVLVTGITVPVIVVVTGGFALFGAKKRRNKHKHLDSPDGSRNPEEQLKFTSNSSD